MKNIRRRRNEILLSIFVQTTEFICWKIIYLYLTLLVKFFKQFFCSPNIGFCWANICYRSIFCCNMLLKFGILLPLRFYSLMQFMLLKRTRRIIQVVRESKCNSQYTYDIMEFFALKYVTWGKIYECTRISVMGSLPWAAEVRGWGGGSLLDETKLDLSRNFYLTLWL